MKSSVRKITYGLFPSEQRWPANEGILLTPIETGRMIAPVGNKGE